MPDIFLSYSRDDPEIARRFAEGFEQAGFSVWWDATLVPGQAFDQVIEKALNEAKAVVVLWSKKSVASRWVRAEATHANDNGTLAPVMIEPCKRPIMFELTHTVDLSHWTGDFKDPVWREYIAAMRHLIDKGAPVRVAESAKGESHRQIRPRMVWPAILAGLILAVGGLFWTFTRVPNHAPSAASVIPASGTYPVSQFASVPTGASLAVLPFADMSPDHNQEYFSDGLSEELLNQLAQLKNLKVAGRTSSFSFKGRNEDLVVIGAKLRVNHLLEGSVRKDGQQLRINAKLIDAADGTQLWSKTYDRTLQNVFAVQEEIATDVANALSVALGLAAPKALPGSTTNVDAYESYLRARSNVEQGGPENYQLAIGQYRKAVQLDPKFARAWSELRAALEYSLVFSPANRAAILSEIAQASERTIALAPDVWWTNAMRARQFQSDHRWAEAEAAAKLALTEAPASEVEATTAYANFLEAVGRAKQALPYYQALRDSEPLSLNVSGDLQVALRTAGQSANAQVEYERSKSLVGAHGEWDWYAILRLWKRPVADQAAVDAAVRNFLENGGSGMIPYARAWEAVLSDESRSLEIIRDAAKGPAVWNDWPRVTTLALVADHLGDKDLALAALHRRLELVNEHYIAWWPFETNLRTDPRFRQIVRSLKLEEYWRSSGDWGDFCKPLGKDDFECH